MFLRGLTTDAKTEIGKDGMALAGMIPLMVAKGLMN